MDTAAFEQMYEAFWEFRSLFVPLFGRRESRDHRQNCILRQADYILNTLDKVSHFFGNLCWQPAKVGHFRKGEIREIW